MIEWCNTDIAVSSVANHSPHFSYSRAVQRHIVYSSAISVPISVPISTAYVTFLPIDAHMSNDYKIFCTRNLDICWNLKFLPT
jgi:hypothetical protein